MSPTGRRRRVLDGLGALAAAAALVLAFSPCASAMPSEAPDETWGTNGRVNAIVQVGNTIYIGGSFTQVMEDGGAGPGTLARNNLAAFDATTGAPTDWAPNANDEVYALVASPDGKRIYAGGKFTSVNLSSRPRLAAIKAFGSGFTESTWRAPFINSTVHALALSGDKLYAGGTFTSVDGAPRERLAAFSTTTATLDAWAPAANGAVYSLALSSDGASVFAGGLFTAVSGQARQKAVALGAQTGAVLSGWRPDPGNKVFSLAVKDNTVYAGLGEAANSIVAWDATTGAQRWRRFSDGDVQAVAVTGNVVYAGGHWLFFQGEPRKKLVALDANTGAVRRDWAPKLPATQETWYGVAALSASGSRVVAGGDFDSVSGFRQERYAQWTGSVGGSSNDTSPPSAPANLTARAIGGSRIELAWDGSSDDDAVADYKIFRNDQEIANSETPSYTDDAVVPDTTYSYRVVAVDFAGHVSAESNTADATTAPPNETRTFTAAEDTYLNAAQPDSNFGGLSTVRVDAEPRTDMLFKFHLSGLAGRAIVGAKLRLYNSDSSNNGGNFSFLPDNSWSEGAVTWNTAPAADPGVVARLDDVAPNNWYEVDVTPIVSGDGTVSVRASSPSTNSAVFHSSEGVNKPQLVVTLAAPGAALPPRTTFSDGFESGDLSRWTDYGGLHTDTAERFKGTWGVRAQSTGQAAFAYKDLSVGRSEVYSQVRFKILNQSANTVSLLKAFTGVGAPIARVFLTTTGNLASRNDVTATASTSSVNVTRGAWHTLQMRTVVGAASRIEVWLDGIKVESLTRTDPLGAAPIGRLQLGDDTGGKAYDIAYDEFVADTAPIPDTSAPTAPASLTATAVPAGGVDLSWPQATDDTAVTGYEIHRDGGLMETVEASSTSFRDNGTEPDTSYEYKVRALDAAGNASPFSTAAQVTTAERDVTPPSAPASLAATAVTFERVDLAWSAAADDTGVTGYRVYRDGELLENVGGSTRSYRDTSVAGNRTYTYSVKAIDAAGNLSEASPDATATTPFRTVFRDGFESGDLSQWTAQTGMRVEQANAQFGSWTSRATSTGEATDAHKVLSSGYRELFYESRFKVLSRASGATAILMRLRTAAGASLVRLYLSGTGKLSTRNDTTGVVTTSSIVVAPGSWHTVRMRLVADGAAGRIDVWLNGNLVSALSKSDSFGTAAIGRVDLGDNSTGKAYDVLFDEVVVDSPPLPAQPPTITGTPRHGEALAADPGSWGGTQPIQHAYQWQRCDAGGQSCSDIAGANQQTYTLVGADVDSTIRAKVTATNSSGEAAATSSPTAQVAPLAPSIVELPAVSGEARDGDTLTAESGTWRGTEPIEFTYKWQRCDSDGQACQDIGGADAPTYNLGAADISARMRVLVTASNRAGSGTAASDPTEPVTSAPPDNRAPPTVSGTARDGETLTADRGVWSGTEPIAYDYAWQRCDIFGQCSDIEGATASTYTLTPADVAARIRVKVTASNDVGSDTVVSDRTELVTAIPPLNVEPPAVSGITRHGQTLAAGSGMWSGTPPMDHSYQWRRCDGSGDNCADIPGADQDQYALTAEDVGNTIRVVVVAANTAGSDSSVSTATTPVDAAPPSGISGPAISGLSRDGETLTADPGEWSGTEPIDYAYQWRRCDASGDNCVDISAADQATYRLTGADVDSTVRVAVTVTNAVGSAGATSDATAVVDPAPPASINTPSIAGTARYGETLTADQGVWAGTEPITYAYQWQHCDVDGDNCTDIDGATADHLILNEDDVDHTIRVMVTATNAIGSDSASSGPTEPVMPMPPDNLEPPTLTGIPRGGETLTGNRGTWSGTEPFEYSYQWQRCDPTGANCDDIPGARQDSYKLAAADVQNTVRLVVTAANGGGSDSAASDATAAVEPGPPVNQEPPTVSGPGREGTTLSAGPGTWSGSDPIDYAFRWQRCDAAGEGCADIAGATQSDYRLAAADVDRTIRLVVTATNVEGSSSATSDPTALVEPGPPVNLDRPSVSGTPNVGETLTADRGAWVGTEAIAYAYRWQRCDAAGEGCADIAGADGQTYQLASADSDGAVRVVITATNAVGSTSAASQATARIATPPGNTQAPTISGTARDGEVLTADRGTWTGTEPISYAYRWQRCDAAGEGCADIAAETTDSYRLAAADVGATVRVAVTATNAAGSESVSSAVSGQVIAAPPANIQPPTLSGMARERETLSADDGDWTGTGPLSYARRWQRCDAGGAGCADIAGATGATYTLTAADVGNTVRAVVTATGPGGSDTAASAASVAIEPYPAVFRDGFESGDLSRWTTNNGLTVDGSDPAAGQWAARAASTGQPDYAYKTLGADHGDLFYELRFKVVSQGSTFSLMKLRTAAGRSLARLFLGSTGKLSTRNDVTGVITTSSTVVTPGAWRRAKVRLQVEGSSSRIEVYLDGNPVPALTKTDSFGTTPIGRVDLGDDAADKIFDVLYDDVLVDVPSG